jgi:hypothetical protein
MAMPLESKEKCRRSGHIAKPRDIPARLPSFFGHNVVLSEVGKATKERAPVKICAAPLCGAIGRSGHHSRLIISSPTYRTSFSKSSAFIVISQS